MQINEIGIIFFQTFLLIAENYIAQTMEYNFAVWTKWMTLFIFCNFTLQLIWLLKRKKLATFGMPVILLSYIFQCSFVILLAFNLIPSDSAIFTLHFKRITFKTYMFSVRFAFNCIALFFMGYVFSSRRENVYKDSNRLKAEHYTYHYALFLTIIFGLFYYISLIATIRGVLQYGNYSILHEVVSSNMMRISRSFYPFFLASAFLLMAYYKEHRKTNKSKLILFILVISCILSFLGGGRGYGTICLTVILILWFSSIADNWNIAFKKKLLLVILGTLILSISTAVRTVRGKSLSVDTVINAFLHPETSLTYAVLSEFGVSSMVTTLLATNYPASFHPFDFFVKEVGAILPRIGDWGGEIFLSPVVRTGIEERYRLGTTYISDLYFYFGRGGVL